MSLLRQIQDSASSGEVSTTILLRKCKILSVRLASSELENWIDNELGGYSDDDKLPEYRVIPPAESKGHFIGPAGRQLRNASIPSAVLEPMVQEAVESMSLTQALPLYEDLLRNDCTTYQIPWPSNVLVYVGRKIIPGYNCLQAWKILPRSALVNVVETVRNRILNFALEVEGVNPEAGEAPIGSQPIADRIVHQIVHQNFYGSVGNVATACHEFQQQSPPLGLFTAEESGEARI